MPATGEPRASAAAAARPDRQRPRATPARRSPRFRFPVPGSLFAVAAAMELVLALGWLRPLALWHHPVNPPDGAPMVTFLGRTRAGALHFALPAVALALLYAAAVWLALRAGRGRSATVVALAAPAVFALTLVPMFPGGTQDLFHNIADARLLWRHGENPTLVPPGAHPEDPFFRHLFGYTELPSSYGPLWYALSGLPAAVAGDGLAANVLAQKVLLVGFFLATVLIVWDTARRVTGHATAAAVLAGWCPLLLWEFAGNGHNDSVMVCLAAAAVSAALRRRWLPVFPLLALSVLVKYTTVLLGPVLLLWLLRRPDVPRRALLGSLALAGVIVVVAYMPFWAGRDTLRVLARPGMTFILSPATLLDGLLRGPLGAAAAARLTQAVTAAAFLLGAGGLVWRLRRDEGGLVARAFDVPFLYLVLASWWFWPWYLSWPVPAAAWAAGRTRAWVFVLMTGTALLTYCYWWSDPPERGRLWFTWYALITAGVFALPFALWWRGLRRTGTGSEGDR